MTGISRREVLIIWVPGGETRPYKAKVSFARDSKESAYYIRKQSSTVRARGEDERELLSLAATVPFDDRYNQAASLDDLSPRLIEEFLREVKSELANDMKNLSIEALGRQMNNRPEAERFWNFPIAAIEEAVVNAVYHRAYDVREPVEVRISTEDLVVLSFPGPDRSIKMEDLRAGRGVSRRYRNRRIGDFLKELDLTEGRSTGIPKILKAMKANGSPAPEFESDEDRTYFLIRLPVHERSVQATPPEVAPQVEKLALAIRGEMTRKEIMDALDLKDRMHFVNGYVQPALVSRIIEMTIPDKPRSGKQRYRLTAAGRLLVGILARSSLLHLLAIVVIGRLSGNKAGIAVFELLQCVSGRGGGLRLLGHGRGVRRQGAAGRSAEGCEDEEEVLGFHGLMGWIWVSAKGSFIWVCARAARACGVRPAWSTLSVVRSPASCLSIAAS